MVTSFLIGVALWLALIITRDIYPSLFSSDSEVKALVKQLTPLLATCIVINNAQTLLSGLAVGAGWQAVVGYMNIICYYAFRSYQEGGLYAVRSHIDLVNPIWQWNSTMKTVDT